MMDGENGDFEMQWAHILWQRHNLRMEDFEKMPRKRKLVYIASELVAMDHPVHPLDKLIYALVHRKGGD